jgi:hypothetical protein
MENQVKTIIPPDQVLIDVIKKARMSFQWLTELDTEWHRRIENHKDGSQIREQQGIILDIFAVYINSLVDKTKGTHSFLRSYKPHSFIEQFNKNPFVKLCIKHRMNRAGHQSEKYGSVAALDVVLASRLDEWLNEAYYLVGTGQLEKR